ASSFTINSQRGITLAGQVGGIDTNGFNTTYGGVIAGTGGFVKAGNGTLTLSGASTYAGATNLRGGTLQLGAANALPTDTALTVNSGATFDLNGNAQQLTGLTGGGSVVNNGGAATLTLNGASLNPAT